MNKFQDYTDYARTREEVISKAYNSDAPKTLEARKITEHLGKVYEELKEAYAIAQQTRYQLFAYSEPNSPSCNEEKQPPPSIATFVSLCSDVVSRLRLVLQQTNSQL
jgi:hypothetical protein